MNDTVVAIVSAFFIIGIFVGIVAVIAAAVFRADQRGRPEDPRELPDHEPGEPDDPWDDTTPDGHPRWPGESDTDFRGR
jgi:hypothetical protein